MPWPEEREQRYGPEQEVTNLPGLRVRVSSEYGGEVKSPVLWRGKVTLFYVGSPLMDIEASLLRSKESGKEPYVAWPQRPYTNRDGETKYTNVIWVHARALSAAAGAAIIAFKKQGWDEGFAPEDLPTNGDSAAEGDDRPW